VNPEDNVMIRRSTPDDLQALVAIEQSCFAIPWSEQSIRADLANPSTAWYWIAELAPGGVVAGAADGDVGEVVGYVACYVAADIVQINNLAVLPAARQRGIGAKLLSALLDLAAASGVTAVDLEVRPSNQPAIALYMRAGFTVVGKRPHYYEDNGEDANIMLKKIT
jgi:ribosomal-protein-alanine N-acetyltransferase